jgi:hypothetical protein
MSMGILTLKQRIRQRYAGFQEAEQAGNVTLVCKRCGISRKTFYKRRKRFSEARGDRGALLDRARRPHHPRRTIGKALRRRLLGLRLV